MTGYILMHAEVTDPEEYEHFKVAAAKAIVDHGGRYLVRGGASTPLEGRLRLQGRALGVPELRGRAGLLPVRGVPGRSGNSVAVRHSQHPRHGRSADHLTVCC